jgi:hypothetical protein
MATDGNGWSGWATDLATDVADGQRMERMGNGWQRMERMGNGFGNGCSGWATDGNRCSGWATDLATDLATDGNRWSGWATDLATDGADGQRMATDNKGGWKYAK